MSSCRAAHAGESRHVTKEVRRRKGLIGGGGEDFRRESHYLA